jgi:uncharacterized protein
MSAPAPMVRRRFGRTELAMPVLSCGGMRYQQGWKDLPPAEVAKENQANLEACIHRALELGINHIETARGYGSSEMQLGWLLPKLPRNEMIIQTKVSPQANAAEFVNVFDQSFKYLGLDQVELLALHGVNTRELLEQSLRPGGSLDGARQIQREGRAKYIGFSTHGPLQVILDLINSGEFDYCNIHWYFVDQHNAPAIDAARRHDMGLFIISPSDKGGKLYAPPAKLETLCQPFTPMAFNDLFCLSRPDVHTLSIGAARPSDFDAHVACLPWLPRLPEVLPPIVQRLDAELRRVWGDEWVNRWQEGLPAWEEVPGQVNLYHTLRLLLYAKAFDMVGYGQMRYNLLGSGGHWFPGAKVDRTEWDKLPAALRQSPFAERIPDLLKEAHDLFNAGDAKRLSQSS